MYLRWCGPDAPGAEIRMDLPPGSAITARSKSGALTVRIGVPGVLGIQAKGRPDVPAGQRAEVVVARLAVGRRSEQPAHPVDRALGLPRLTDVVVQPRHPEARLVTGPQIGLVGADVELHGEAVEPVRPPPRGRRARSPGRPRCAAPTRRIARRCPRRIRPGRSPRGNPRTPGPRGRSPVRLRGEMYRVVGLNRFCQYCDRFWNSAAVAASPSESANREMAKSSTDHSSVIEASAIQPSVRNSNVNGA